MTTQSALRRPRFPPERAAPAAPAAATQLSVLLPLPLDRPFDYRAVPAGEGGTALTPGTFVEVPFGSREVVGVVWDAPPARRVPAARLKDVQRRLEAPPMPPGLRRLIEHVAAITLAPLGAALRLALSVPAALEPPTPKTGYVAAPDAAAGGAAAAPRLTAARRKVLTALLEDGGGGPLAAADLARAAGVGAGVVQAMAKAGLLHAVALQEEPDSPGGPDPDATGPALSPEQERAAQALRRAAATQAHGVILLEGVPGAGKTEVYFEAVAETLRRGRQVLVLLPEIALSAQWLERFARRFGAPPAVWHSDLTAAQRRRTWRRIAEGRERVVVGARSALFLPLAELGLIIVDEEHDASFKQEDGVAYHARDMALARAAFEGCPAILVSATPSLESALAADSIVEDGGGGGAATAMATAEPRRYAHLLLPARHRDVPMPRVDVVDLKFDPPPRGGWLSPRLRRGLAATLDAGEQALLFLNRRGYAPLTLCRACGHRVQCPNCTAWLVEHRLRRRLQCHHCGYGVPEPEHCPACGSLESLVPCGPGVERVAEEVAGLLPGARLAVMTSDSIRNAKDAADLVGAMRDHRVDVLVGTQIIAKGHHFPDLTLVGVVDGDLGLGGGDLRAAERSFQLLYQVAGRAGRAERPGRVVVQTHLPEHPVMRALADGDKARFYAAEALQRRADGMPPFGRLAALVVSGRDLNQVRRAARKLAETAPEEPGFIVLGPAPAPLALLRGRHRQRLLVKARPGIDLPSRLRRWLRGLRLGGGVRLQVDVDPYSFL